MTQHFFLSLACLFFACTNAPIKTAEQVESNHDKSLSATQIDIQPFVGMSEDEVNYTYTELKKILPNTQLKKAITLPKMAYYKPRNRYRADSLIDFLGRNTAIEHVTIGLTHKDISATKDKIVDWGVMGLGFCPGNACVVSTFRLSKSEKKMQLFKVAIHELGHTQGLPHCEVKSCFMRDAEGRNPTNEETEFCAKCKKYLEEKGWLLN